VIGDTEPCVQRLALRRPTAIIHRPAQFNQWLNQFYLLVVIEGIVSPELSVALSKPTPVIFSLLFDNWENSKWGISQAVSLKILNHWERYCDWYLNIPKLRVMTLRWHNSAAMKILISQGCDFLTRIKERTSAPFLAYRYLILLCECEATFGMTFAGPAVRWSLSSNSRHSLHCANKYYLQNRPWSGPVL